jgi:rsbT co-antagonist protein RsbR
MSVVATVLKKNEADILEHWIREMASITRRSDLMGDAELREQCRRFLNLVQEATQSGNLKDITAPPWAPTREFLASVSASRARQGFTPSDTAVFVFSLKKPVLGRLQKELSNNPEAMLQEFNTFGDLADKLGVFTLETFMKAREQVIASQQQEMLELSTPVVKLWEGILALPLIGTLDSARTQVVMETLLQKVVETGSEVAIIDITGVPTVDTLVAQHLIKTVTAARLMGADCIISGIRPQIAQTIVHLGVALGDVTTKANLADAFILALERIGSSIDGSAAKKRASKNSNNIEAEV